MHVSKQKDARQCVFINTQIWKSKSKVMETSKRYNQLSRINHQAQIFFIYPSIPTIKINSIYLSDARPGSNLRGQALELNV